MTTYDPNGNNWVASDSMGKRLLIKAGWSSGEGLGKYKQGSNVHIKVSLKNEKDGIGLKSGKRENDLSLMQCFTFDNILKSKYGKSTETNDEEEKQMERGLSRARFGRAVPKEFFNPVASDDLNKILCKSKVDKKSELPVNNIEKITSEGNANFFSSYTVFEYFSMKMKSSNIKLDNLNGFIFNKLDSVQNLKQSDTNDLENNVNIFEDKEHDSPVDNMDLGKTEDLLTTENVSIIKKKSKKSEKVDENLSENIAKNKRKSLKSKNKSLTEGNELDSEISKISKSKKKLEFSNSEFEITSGANKSNKHDETICMEIDNKISQQIISDLEKNIINKSSKKKSKKRKLSDSKSEDIKNKKCKKIHSVTLASSEDDVAKNNLVTQFSASLNKSSVNDSIEIIEDHNFCPWNTSNVNEIEGYKYY